MNECPCKKLVDANDAVHQLAHECERMAAANGDTRGIRRVYMKAYYPDSLVGRIISRFTWSKEKKRKFCHVSTLIYPKTIDIGVKELWEIESTNKKGVHEHAHDLNARAGEYFYMDLTIEQYRNVVARGTQILGCKYDRPGNLGFVLRRRIEDPERWFCSESQAHTFEVDAPFIRKPAYKVNPYDCVTSMIWTPCSRDEVLIR